MIYRQDFFVLAGVGGPLVPPCLRALDLTHASRGPGSAHSPSRAPSITGSNNAAIPGRIIQQTTFKIH
jgi:hypothetical protein